MNDPIDPAIVEVAAKALDWETHRFCVDADSWTPFCGCGWQASTPFTTAEFDRHLAELALEAAAPLIRAQALREAADDINARRNGPELIAAADKWGSYYSGVRVAIENEETALRARADALEAGQS